VEVAVLARHHPVSAEETCNRADDLLDGLRSEVSADVYAAAEARGWARDLEATMRELLEEMSSEVGSMAAANTEGGHDA